MRWLRWLLASLVTCVMLTAGPARAEGDATLPRELDALGAWIAAKSKTVCTERCFVLQRLRLGGSVDKGLTFTLEGAVLADGPVAVPLFGPPDRVRIENATITTPPGTKGGGAPEPAAIGFEADHYFVVTAARRFVLQGTLSVHGDRALVVSGPLNVLEADLADGHVMEGARLSGLAATTLHFDGGKVAAAAEQPAVFQLSRRIRVERQTAFDYKLTLRAGTDLGVVRLPLPNGEKVLDVAGASGWRIEGAELVLPTAGHSAEVTITGTLDPLQNKTFSPDARSTYEWWQLDADPEHRLTVSGEARQLDAGESPFARTPSSRLFLVQRGQTLVVAVQTLAAVEALAAVVQNDARTVVITPRGDVVFDDALTYENNGIDYLGFGPEGRAIFLATDGAPERIFRDDGAPRIQIPLQKGLHTARVQSIAHTPLSPFGGRAVFDGPGYDLAASKSTLTVGLPRGVHPLVVFGGDVPDWFFGAEDAIAIAVAFAAAWIVFARRSARVLAAIALGGLWLVSTGAFTATVVALVAVGAARVLARLARGRSFGHLRWVLVAGAGVLALVALVSLSRKAEDRAETASARLEERRVDAPMAAPSSATTDAYNKAGTKSAGDEAKNDKETEKLFGTLAADGKLAGVRPVALPLPGFARAVTVSRELVTRDRPFRAIVVYVTDWALAPFGLLWLAAIALLVWLHRAELRAARDRARTWLAERPAPPLLPQAPPASPAPPAE